MKGQQCSFRSINVNDPTTYTGTIVGISVDSDIANNFTDIVSYNSASRLTNPSIPQDLTQLDYFIISISNPSGDNEKIAFAEQWVDSGSFALISSNVKRTFTVYSTPDRTSQDIINILRASGITAVENT